MQAARIERLEHIDQLPIVWKLTHDAFVSEGYCAPQPDGLLKHHLALDITNGQLNRNTTILISYVDDKPVATCSLTLDSEFGLHTDKAFRDETDRFRLECKQQGLILASSWRIVTTRDVSPRITMNLIHETLLLSIEKDVDILLCTFNPKHKKFYCKRLGMEFVAQSDNETGLVNAPTVLLKLCKESYGKYNTKFVS